MEIRLPRIVTACADINGDYQIDIIDIAVIAKQYGWVGSPILH